MRVDGPGECERERGGSGECGEFVDREVDICERGRLPPEEALDYFQQLMGAINYCHRFNVAHRDLKPENLLLDRDKNLKVADFGMAAWQKGAGDLLETSCGSPHYAAPEVVNGEPYDGSVSDTWSCGVILFALLAGRLPFDDENLLNLLEKIKVGKFVMPSDIPTPAQDLIRKMLEKDPKKRIKVVDVLKHPWYISQPARASSSSPPSLKELAKPVPNAADIEPDILANLRTLWHVAPDEDILAKLTNKEKNWEKAVYHLLVQYREKQLEDYKEVERIRTERRKERKRRERAEREREKAARKLEERECERPTTPLSRPPRPDPPTPRRAGGRGPRHRRCPPAGGPARESQDCGRRGAQCRRSRGAGATGAGSGAGQRGKGARNIRPVYLP